MAPRGLDPRTDTAPVQDAGEPAEAVEDVLTVGVPPRHGHPARVPVGELHLRALVQPLLGVRAAEP